MLGSVPRELVSFSKRVHLSFFGEGSTFTQLSPRPLVDLDNFFLSSKPWVFISSQL